MNCRKKPYDELSVRTKTGIQLGPPFLHGKGVRLAAFSPDGKTVITASSDTSARLWQVPPVEPGTIEKVTLSTQVLTGEDLDPDGKERILTAAAWRAARERLEKSVGTSVP
jgi:WD40 repeat protein